MQGSYDAYNHLTDDPEKQQALEYFTGKVYILLDYTEMEQLGNLHNKVGHTVLKRTSIEIIKSLRRGWVEADRPIADNKQDKKFKETKEHIFKTIEIKEPSEWNQYNHEWTLATTPEDFFNVLLDTFKCMEEGTLLHQANDRKKEDIAMAKEQKKRQKNQVRSTILFKSN
jgi:hypothetical protein